MRGRTGNARYSTSASGANDRWNHCWRAGQAFAKPPAHACARSVLARAGSRGAPQPGVEPLRQFVAALGVTSGAADLEEAAGAAFVHRAAEPGGVGRRRVEAAERHRPRRTRAPTANGPSLRSASGAVPARCMPPSSAHALTCCVAAGTALSMAFSHTAVNSSTAPAGSAAVPMPSRQARARFTQPRRFAPSQADPSQPRR